MLQTVHSTPPKGDILRKATLHRLTIFLVMQLSVVFFAGFAKSSEITAQIPMFRHVDPSALVAGPPTPRNLKLLADQDFAPWSFVTAGGEVKGISVDLALSACKAVAATCTVKAVPFTDLLPGLQRGEADVVVSGIRPTAGILEHMVMTKPYFMSFGRFVTRLGSPVQATDIRAMAGRRVGSVKGTSHAAWLKQYYARSALSEFDNFDAMGEALRTGSIDAVFGDSVQIAFWLKGPRARNCCVTLGKAYIDRETFSRNLVFVTKKDDAALVDALNNSLDQLEANGTTAQVFSAYLPGPVW
jgi:polar amino acid transport system substrate-binding protein